MKKNLLTLDVALSKEIKYMLKEEHYLPGDKLPSERKLAELFHVQRLTVRGALNLLLQDKTIISKPRSGYYPRAFDICVEKIVKAIPEVKPTING